MSMITITRTETRPTLNVDWYRTPNSFITYIQKYNDIRHRTVYGWTLSPDMLSRTHVVSYSSQADYDKFLADPVVMESIQTTTNYNNINNITEQKTIS